MNPDDDLTINKEVKLILSLMLTQVIVNNLDILATLLICWMGLDVAW